jgi:DNA anti-recombination protein RmuC
MTKVVKTTAKVSKVAIVNKAMKANNLGVMENLENFYEVVLENLQEQLEDKKDYILDLEKSHNKVVKDLQRFITDADKVVARSFLSVNQDNIQTFDAIKKETVEYWTRVHAAQRSKKGLEDQLKLATEAYDLEVAMRNTEVKQIEAYIAEITKA